MRRDAYIPSSPLPQLPPLVPSRHARLRMPCELCLNGSTLNAVRHRCYRGSYRSASVAWMVSCIGGCGLQSKVDRFIALTVRPVRLRTRRASGGADRRQARRHADPTEYMDLGLSDLKSRSGTTRCSSAVSASRRVSPRCCARGGRSRCRCGSRDQSVQHARRPGSARRDAGITISATSRPDVYGNFFTRTSS
jgi:hypothetical protein